MKYPDKAYNLLSNEILYRSVYVFLCFVFCSIISWAYEKELLFLYLEPLIQLHQNIMYTSISEAFYTSLRLCIWASLACSFPYLVYQSFCFFLPSFFPNEKLFFYKKGFYVVIFYITSFVICRSYIIPELCSWFLKFGVSTEGLFLSLQARVSNYLSWSGKLYIISLCIFQIPYLFWVLLQLGIWKNKKPFGLLSKTRKYAGIGVLLLCAIISPPDLYSQGTLSLVSLVIYEYVLWYSFLNQALHFKRSKKNK